MSNIYPSISEKLAALNIGICHHENLVRCYVLAKLNIGHSGKPDYSSATAFRKSACLSAGTSKPKSLQISMMFFMMILLNVISKPAVSGNGLSRTNRLRGRWCEKSNCPEIPDSCFHQQISNSFAAAPSTQLSI